MRRWRLNPDVATAAAYGCLLAAAGCLGLAGLLATL